MYSIFKNEEGSPRNCTPSQIILQEYSEVGIDSIVPQVEGNFLGDQIFFSEQIELNSNEVADTKTKFIVDGVNVDPINNEDESEQIAPQPIFEITISKNFASSQFYWEIPQYLLLKDAQCEVEPVNSDQVVPHYQNVDNNLSDSNQSQILGLENLKNEEDNWADLTFNGDFLNDFNSSPNLPSQVVTEVSATSSQPPNFTDQENLSEHTVDELEKKNNRYLENLLFIHKCPRCDYKSCSPAALRSHIRSHFSEHAYVCIKCPYRTTAKASFLRHARRHEERKPYKCEYCTYETSQQNALAIHTRRHFDIKPYHCPNCSFKCSDRSSLVRHMRRHTGVKPYSCYVCKYKCSQISSLKTHLEMHKKIRKCKRCSFTTLSRSSMHKHTLTHTPASHKCPICPYSSKSKNSVKVHLRRHKREKPFTCPHCPYSSVEKTHLSRHLKTHTGDKPIFCFACSYRCIQFVSMVRHMKKHNGHNIQCAFCVFQTKSADAIIQHIRTQHKGSWLKIAK